jgi:hypothetical protein
MFSSISLYGITWSLSYMVVPQAAVSSVISINMGIEIAAIKALNEFYKKFIIAENEKKRENMKKLIKLNTKEILLIEEINHLDQKIKEVIVKEHE